MKKLNAVSEVKEVGMTSRITENLGKVSLVLGTGVLASSSYAALDVAPLVTEIESNSGSMQTVMLAVLALLALYVGYKMIKRSMS